MAAGCSLPTAKAMAHHPLLSAGWQTQSTSESSTHSPISSGRRVLSGKVLGPVRDGCPGHWGAGRVCPVLPCPGHRGRGTAG